MARITSRSSSPITGMPISSSGTPARDSAWAMAIFLLGGERHAGGLLAVAQGRIVDGYHVAPPVK